MNKESIYKRIKEFETEENILNFESEYGNLWPVFRMHIFNNAFSENKTKLEYRNRLYITLSEIKQFYKKNKNYKFEKGNKLKENKDIAEIWFSNHKLRYENKDKYNKYLDPFFIELASDNAIIYEEAINLPAQYSFLIHEKKLNIQNIIPIFLNYQKRKLIRKILKINYNYFIKKYKINKLLDKFPEYNAYGFFINYLSFVDTYNFYTYIFNKYTNLKIIHLVAYYFTENMAIIAAANKKKIETVEIQHGMQSKAHYAYGNWNYIPTKGYDLLPTKFYVFSEKEKTLILDSFKHTHKVKIVGDLNFQNWKKNNNKRKKDIILISLQNKVIPEKDFLYKALEELYAKNKKIKIVFRLHPRHLYIKKHIQNLLENTTFVYSWDTNKEIFDTLSKTIIHITSYSSVVEDALLLNVPSVVITKLGAEFYKDRINEKKVYKALNKNDLVEIINKNIEKYAVNN